MTTDWVGQRVFYPAVEDVVNGSKGLQERKTHYITEIRYPRRGGYQSFAAKRHDEPRKSVPAKTMVMRQHEPARRILVTGGAGFLGSHLQHRRLEQGHEALCVDNLFTGTKRNIEHLVGHPRFELLQWNTCLSRQDIA